MRKRKGRNRRRKVPLYRRSSLILLLTIIYILFFVAPVFFQQFREANVSADVKLWQEIQDGVTAFVQIFCLLLGLAVFRVFWIILWPLLCVLTALGDYMVRTFHSQISKDSVAVVLESTSREVSNFFNSDLILALASGLGVAILGLAMLKREKKDPRNFRISAIALLLAAALITINGGTMSTRFAPYNFLTAATQYMQERMMYSSTPRKNISAYSSNIKMRGDKPPVIVIVLGESARGDHFSINGYARETTPLLQQRLNAGKNLVNFKDTSSCGVFTRISVPCILTRATEADKTPMYTETSLISLFKSLGFYTAWLGAQTIMGPPLVDIIHEANYYTLLEDKQFLDNTIKDEQLLPLLDNVLNGDHGPTLIVLHTFGSHWQYSARYTKNFERYTPVCDTTLSRNYNVGVQVAEIKSCTQAMNNQALVNGYDNSILYTDYILDQIMHRLEDKNALMVYSSDHGESLGEHGRYLHGYENAPENHVVPMFWWASDSFIANNSEHWQALTAKSSAPSSHDVIFHSILDCSGVSSPLIDPALSLCHNDQVVAPQAPQTPVADDVKPSDTELVPEDMEEDREQQNMAVEAVDAGEAAAVASPGMVPNPTITPIEDNSQATDDTDSAAPHGAATKAPSSSPSQADKPYSDDEKMLLKETK